MLNGGGCVLLNRIFCFSLSFQGCLLLLESGQLLLDFLYLGVSLGISAKNEQLHVSGKVSQANQKSERQRCRRQHTAQNHENSVFRKIPTRNGNKQHRNTGTYHSNSEIRHGSDKRQELEPLNESEQKSALRRIQRNPKICIVNARDPGTARPTERY